jgi:hypothetical protein
MGEAMHKVPARKYYGQPRPRQSVSCDAANATERCSWLADHSACESRGIAAITCQGAAIRAQLLSLRALIVAPPLE